MAEQTIQIKIKVDSKTGEIQLKSMEKGFEKITLSAKQAEQAAKHVDQTCAEDSIYKWTGVECKINKAAIISNCQLLSEVRYCNKRYNCCFWFCNGFCT